MNFLVNQVLRQKLLQSTAVKIKRDLVAIKATTIRCQHGYMLRHCVHELPKFPLRLLPILKVGPCGVPTYDFTLLTAEWLIKKKEPAILSISPKDSRLNCERNPGRHPTLFLVIKPRQVIWVKMLFHLVVVQKILQHPAVKIQ